MIPTARDHETSWRYTTERPAERWMARRVRRSRVETRTWRFWHAGHAGCCGSHCPGMARRSGFAETSIFPSREIGADPSTLRLLVHHDEDADIYLNGVLAARVGGYTADYQPVRIRPDALKVLKPGRNSLAVHCRQTSWGSVHRRGPESDRDRGAVGGPGSDTFPIS